MFQRFVSYADDAQPSRQGNAYPGESVPERMRQNRTEIPALDWYGQCVLTLIAVLLAVIAMRAIASPVVASAQSAYGYLYIEPRTTTLRNPDGSQQLQGKVVIDLRNGKIWGFP